MDDGDSQAANSTLCRKATTEPSVSGDANEQQAGLPVFDAKKYLPHLNEFEIAEEQKIEILKSLWFIMATFAQISYGIDSVQLIIPRLEHVDPNLATDRVPSHH